MKEGLSQLTPTTGSTIIDLDNETKEKLCKELQSLIKTLSTILVLINHNEFNSRAKTIFLKSIHRITHKLFKIFDFKSQMIRDDSKRVQQVRDFKEDNKRLRKRLGEKVTPNDIKEYINNSKQTICDFWQTEGFGTAVDISYKTHGAVVKFYGMNEKTEQVHKNRKRLGIEFGSDTEISVKDNDKNKKIIENLILERFPSAEILSIECVYRYKAPTINAIKVRIWDLDDIENITLFLDIF